tara:strand:- start:11152 stop:11379 length:228 start_codon:yes stop_codon:yes gene_type:complete
MEYITCPTCGYLIGQKSIEYNLKKEKICLNNNYTQEQKDNKLVELMQSLKIRRYCCRMRLMCCKDLSKEIIAPVE